MEQPEAHQRQIARKVESDSGLSLDGTDLLRRAAENPKAYWQDIEGWMGSENPIRAAEGHLMAGAVCRIEEPERAVGYFEEARRLFIGQNYYLEAARTCEILALLYEHSVGDAEAAQLHRELAEEYHELQREGRDPRLEPRLMDDDD